MEKVRGFELVSKYVTEQVQMPKRGTKKSACYDILNNTGADILLISLIFFLCFVLDYI